MHRGDHDHHHGPLGGHHHPHGGPGHNHSSHVSQWQTPHRPDEPKAIEEPSEADLDLVEASFIEGFGQSTDITSFLRLAGIPFVAIDGGARRLSLLRVEVQNRSDVGTVMPLLGGGGYRYDPLPARFVSRRRSLAFAYHDGTGTVQLDFAAARALRAAEDDAAVPKTALG